jgi:hypothetical protein
VSGVVVNDAISPVVVAFSSAVGAAILNWSVTDLGGSHIDRIEIWRAQDSGGSPGPWAEVSALRQNLSFLNTDIHVGSITDNPTPGDYWYGIRVIDQAGNCTNHLNQDCTSGTPNGASSYGPFFVSISDVFPPTIPDNLATTTLLSDQIDITWNAATDDVAVAGYNIYRDSVFLVSVPGTSYSDTGLSPNTSYTYTVTAFDAVGNESGQSTPVTDRTPPDTNYPIVNIFNALPPISTANIDISWTVTDAGGSYLDHIEVWRAPDMSGAPGAWAEIAGLRQTIAALNVNSDTNTVVDSPGLGGWWYGIRVVDQAGNCTNHLNEDCTTGVPNGASPLSPLLITIVPPNCPDGTPLSACSVATGQPWYCDNMANLIEDCTICGCSGIWQCSSFGTFCCDNACDGNCSNPGCTVVEDPDCGGAGCCGDLSCDAGDCITCPSDCYISDCYPNGTCDPFLIDGNEDVSCCPLDCP